MKYKSAKGKFGIVFAAKRLCGPTVAKVQNYAALFLGKKNFL